MHGKSFDFGQVLGFGWRVMKDNFLFFVGLLAILVAFSLPLQLLQMIEQYHPGQIPPVLGLLLIPVTLIINIILGIGIIKISLSFCDEQRPKFSMLFNGWDCFWRYVGTGLLYSLITMGACMACIFLPRLLFATIGIPYFDLFAFIVAFILMLVLLIKFSLCFYFVVDKGLGPVDALRASSRTTKNAKWQLFVFGVLCSLMNLLGVLCFVIGTFATLPTVMVAMAIVYRQLSAQTSGLEELGIGSRGIHPAHATQSDIGICSGLAIRLSPAIQPASDIQPGPAIQPDTEKKRSHFFLLVVILGVAVAIAAGIAYYSWPAAKKVVPLSKRVSLTGILYAEDNPSAIVDGEVVHEEETINGVKVIKIYEDKVEFEKAGERWSQRM